MIVELPDDHDVTDLRLIAPDGSLFAETSVATGVTQVQLQIAAIEPGGSDYTHYSPGQHELIAETGSDTQNKEILLEPSIQINDISQFGPEPEQNGKLAVTVENEGTGPTWVFDIVYRNAPNDAANGELVSEPGVPQLTSPDETAEQIIAPNDLQTFVGTTNPLGFNEQDNSRCDGEYSFSVIVGAAVGDPIRGNITVHVRGESQSIGLAGEYTCSDISVEVTDVGESDG